MDIDIIYRIFFNWFVVLNKILKKLCNIDYFLKKIKPQKLTISTVTIVTFTESLLNCYIFNCFDGAHLSDMAAKLADCTA